MRDRFLTALAAPAFFIAGALAWNALVASFSPDAHDTTCIGSGSASRAVVYLHGLDTPGPSWLERQNRAVLAELAHRLDLRIALPRAPGGAFRFGSPADREASRALIDEAAQTCSLGQELGLIGFSRGGWLANDLHASGEVRGIEWIVTVGAAGDARLLELPVARPPLRLVAGRKDPGAVDGMGLLARAFSRAGEDVELVVHGGGHLLPFAELHRTLAALLAGGAP